MNYDPEKPIFKDDVERAFWIQIYTQTQAVNEPESPRPPREADQALRFMRFRMPDALQNE